MVYYAMLLMCCMVQAFQEGKYYPDYVWILYGWYSNNWWTRTSTSCNNSQLLTALERAISLQSYPTTQNTADNVMVQNCKNIGGIET